MIIRCPGDVNTYAEQPTHTPVWLAQLTKPKTLKTTRSLESIEWFSNTNNIFNPRPNTNTSDNKSEITLIAIWR